MRRMWATVGAVYDRAPLVSIKKRSLLDAARCRACASRLDAAPTGSGFLLIPASTAPSAALRRDAAQGNDGAAVRSREAPCPGVFRTISGGVCRNGDFFAGRDESLIDTSVEAVSNEYIRSGDFKSPID